MRRRDLLTGLAGAATFSATTGVPLPAWAQGPAPATTKLLVGATPGGGTDLVARALAQELAGRLRRGVIVDNRPGAAGNIAAGAVAKAEPDGGTLLLSYTSHAINPALFGKLPFDAVKDFTPLSLVATSPLMLVARPGLKAANLRELVAQAKAGNTALSIAVAGVGSANHLAGEMLRVQTGLNLVSVPYKGASPAVSDVMGNQVDLLFSNMATVQQLVRSGKVRPLAVSTAQRVAGFPDVAPVAELVPGFDYSSWYGLFAPAGLPAEAASQLAAATRASLASAEMQQRLQGEGLAPVGNTPGEFAAFLRAEISRWTQVVAATGAKPA
ncbi:tripartite tricarboxylate transporter substrate-binding protein [Ideonella sp. DXS22W]|uniref:Tripartite tricarboxylate transporter substrate-binding protein n=1 Tax=Pseudaquabacterium inlustre TaxID=2984192 RepID=A0ABU9CGK1_9BURK